MAFPDFNEFLHKLRSLEVENMPAGARIFVSAGCSGRWYFDWIAENYPGIKMHLGIEAYSPQPESLPPEAIWLPDYLYDIKSVGNNEVDLIFAGQTVEHLWPRDISGFFCEAHRILKADGWFILDSPNRLITQSIGWWQPEHVTELSVDEAINLLNLAGFHEVNVRGIWLCYSREMHKYLPLEPDLAGIDIETDVRVKDAFGRPEDSFIWWIEARKDESKTPNLQMLLETSQLYYERFISQALNRVFSNIGKMDGYCENRIIFANKSHSGFLRFGPYIPLNPGKYMAQFGIIQSPNSMSIVKEKLNEIALILDVTSHTGAKIISRKEIYVKDLIKSKIDLRNRKNTLFFPIDIFFELQDVAFGVEFRAYSTGKLPITLKERVRLFDLNFLYKLGAPTQNNS